MLMTLKGLNDQQHHPAVTDSVCVTTVFCTQYDKLTLQTIKYFMLMLCHSPKQKNIGFHRHQNWTRRPAGNRSGVKCSTNVTNNGWAGIRHLKWGMFFSSFCHISIAPANWYDASIADQKAFHLGECFSLRTWHRCDDDRTWAEMPQSSQIVFCNVKKNLPHSISRKRFILKNRQGSI